MKKPTIADRDKKGRFVKGHSGDINFGKGTFQKGHEGYLKHANKTSFKKGNVPWSKGLKSWYSGEKHWNFGKKCPEVTKRKISEALKGSVSPNKGKKLSQEVRRKISEANKGKHDSEYYRKIGIKGVKAQQDGRPTSIEIKLYDELKRKELLFETQKVINDKFVVDAYIPRLNLVIEADGDYWHSLERVKKKDKAKNAYLIKCGFSLLRLTGTEINNGNFIKKLEGNLLK